MSSEQPMDSVKYNNLGLIIIDEEHRFGVKQKKTI
jgi:transcription-repair coupling factor (superfamily II helicase)